MQRIYLILIVFNLILVIINSVINCAQLDSNSVCYAFRCFCKPNYYLNKITRKCELGYCDTDKDCQTNDPNKYCVVYKKRHSL